MNGRTRKHKRKHKQTEKLDRDIEDDDECTHNNFTVERGVRTCNDCGYSITGLGEDDPEETDYQAHIVENSGHLRDIKQSLDHLVALMQREWDRKNGKKRKKKLKKMNWSLTENDQDQVRKMIAVRMWENELDFEEVDSDGADTETSYRVRFHISDLDADEFDLPDLLSGQIVEAVIERQVTHVEVIKIGENK